MSPATPMPMTTSASRTLTAAMMPSNTFVVDRSTVMQSPLERRGLMGARHAARRAADRSQRLVQHLPAFVGHAGQLLHRRAELDELAVEVVKRRFNRVADGAPAFGEEEVAGQSAKYGADHSGCNGSRVSHARLP